MDVTSLVNAPGARKATGADIMREARGPVRTVRSAYDRPGGGIRPGAAPGADRNLANHKEREASSAEKNKSSIIGSIKKWLVDRNQRKIDAQKEMASKHEAAVKAAREEAQRSAVEHTLRIQEELAKIKQQLAQQRRTPPPIDKAKMAEHQAKVAAESKARAAASHGARIASGTHGDVTYLKEGDYEEVKPKPKAIQAPKPQAKPPPPPQQAKPKPQPQLMAPPKPSKNLPMPNKGPEAAKSMLRGKKGGRYYLSKGGKKVYAGAA